MIVEGGAEDVALWVCGSSSASVFSNSQPKQKYPENPDSKQWDESSPALCEWRNNRVLDMPRLDCPSCERRYRTTPTEELLVLDIPHGAVTTPAQDSTTLSCETL